MDTQNKKTTRNQENNETLKKTITGNSRRVMAIRARLTIRCRNNCDRSSHVGNGILCVFLIGIYSTQLVVREGRERESKREQERDSEEKNGTVD